MLASITGPVRRRLTLGNTVALLALFVALGGTSYATVLPASDGDGTSQLREESTASAELPRREFAVVNANGTLRYGTPGVSVKRYQGNATGRYIVTFNRDVFRCALSATIATARDGDVGAGPFSILAGPDGPGAVFVRTGFAPNKPDVDEPFYLVATC